MGFYSGFVTGAGILTGELAYFFGGMLLDKFCEIILLLPYSPPEIDSLNTIVVSALFIISLSGFIAGFLVGSCSSADFAVGYIVGDYTVFFLTMNVLWPIAPSVVISMALIPLSIIVGFIFRTRF